MTTREDLQLNVDSEPQLGPNVQHI